VYYNSKAKRPNNSRLDCSDIKEKFDIELPDWRNSLKLIIKDLENIS
jgi:dTDP-4-dehydrorhamnose reductase